MGSICFYSTLWHYKEGSIQDISLNICQTEGGSCFDLKLQALFNRKMQNKIEKLLKPLIKPRKYNFDKLFNKNLFVENKKYLMSDDVSHFLPFFVVIIFIVVK